MHLKINLLQHVGMPIINIENAERFYERLEFCQLL
jgi:hypothetical protein